MVGALSMLVTATQAGAQTVADRVIEQLKRKGYTRITIGRTLLGRVRIVATGTAGRREIILNPSTGAILRDYLDQDDGLHDDTSGSGNDGSERKSGDDGDSAEDNSSADESDDNSSDDDNSDDSDDES